MTRIFLIVAAGLVWCLVMGFLVGVMKGRDVLADLLCRERGFESGRYVSATKRVTCTAPAVSVPLDDAVKLRELSR